MRKVKGKKVKGKDTRQKEKAILEALEDKADIVAARASVKDEFFITLEELKKRLRIK